MSTERVGEQASEIAVRRDTLARGVWALEKGGERADES
jgi:hypothetical protein